MSLGSVRFGKVVFRVLAGVGDGPDANNTPDGVPVTGIGTLTPKVERIVDRGGVFPAVTVIPQPIKVSFVDGYLTYRGDPFVWLIASEMGVWRWHAAFTYRVGNVTISDEFMFDLPPGEPDDVNYRGTDLSLSRQVVDPSNGLVTVVGPPGRSVADVVVKPDGLMFVMSIGADIDITIPNFGTLSEAAASAVDAAERSGLSEGAAAVSAAAAEGLARGAGESRVAAAGSASDAAASAALSQGSAVAAEGSQVAAASSAAAAAGSASSAAASEGAAGGAEGVATANAAVAVGKAGEAVASAAAAVVSESAAGVSRSEAAGFADAAEIARIAAARSAVDAEAAGGVPAVREVKAGVGLIGGGDLSENRVLSADFGEGKGKVVEGDDPRMSDSRRPTSHTHSKTSLTSSVRASLDKADSAVQLDESGLVPQSQLPSIALTDFLGAVGTQAAMVKLVGQRGDWCTRTELGTDWQLIAEPPSELASWRERTYPASPVSSVFGRKGVITGAKGDVGLGRVDNTSDADKPVSVAVAAAIAGKVGSSNLSVLDHVILTAAEYVRLGAGRPSTTVYEIVG